MSRQLGFVVQNAQQVINSLRDELTLGFGFLPPLPMFLLIDNRTALTGS